MSSSFPKRLKQLREEANLSQTELAEKLSISRGSLSFYEQGAREPNLSTIKALCTYFSVTGDFLLGITDNNEKIKVFPPQLSEEIRRKLAALRIVWPEYKWVAVDDDGEVFLSKDEPILYTRMYDSKSEWYDIASTKDPFKGEITFDMGPIYYGDLRLKGEVL